MLYYLYFSLSLFYQYLIKVANKKETEFLLLQSNHRNSVSFFLIFWKRKKSWLKFWREKNVGWVGWDVE